MSMDNAPLRFPECPACGQGIDENDPHTPHIILNRELFHERCVDVGELDDDELKIVREFASTELSKRAQNEYDNRAEAAGMRQFERDMEGGYDAYTGDMRMRDSMAEARKLK